MEDPLSLHRFNNLPQNEDVLAIMRKSSRSQANFSYGRKMASAANMLLPIIVMVMAKAYTFINFPIDGQGPQRAGLNQGVSRVLIQRSPTLGTVESTDPPSKR